MDRLTVLCFAGTYALALVCDLARFAVRSGAGVNRFAVLGLTVLGLLVHTAYLGNLAWRRQAVPITSVFESLLVLAWVLAAIDLYLVARASKPTAIGPLMLILVLAVLVVAGLWADRGTNWSGWGGWSTFWGMVHGVFLTLGAVCTCLAFVFGLMYLAQVYRLKHKRAANRVLSLPSLEQSERWNRGAITLAFPLLTAGMLIGLGLNLATRKAGGAGLGWTDPKILSTLALWVVFAALLHARFRPEWRGRRVMILTVVAFAFLAFAMVGVGLILPTAHGGLSTLDRGRTP